MHLLSVSIHSRWASLVASGFLKLTQGPSRIKICQIQSCRQASSRPEGCKFSPQSSQRGQCVQDLSYPLNLSKHYLVSGCRADSAQATRYDAGSIDEVRERRRHGVCSFVTYLLPNIYHFFSLSMCENPGRGEGFNRIGSGNMWSAAHSSERTMSNPPHELPRACRIRQR
ncbi:hypothetical protein C8R43DRAFT_113271 [Mycena crocata]|nr:hypothetical protein C8R43DRAFT_113271 [Mycena crocata]